MLSMKPCQQRCCPSLRSASQQPCAGRFDTHLTCNCIVPVMCAGVNAFLHMEDGMLGYQWARAIAAMVSRDTGQ